MVAEKYCKRNLTVAKILQIELNVSRIKVVRCAMRKKNKISQKASVRKLSKFNYSLEPSRKKLKLAN